MQNVNQMRLEYTPKMIGLTGETYRTAVRKTEICVISAKFTRLPEIPPQKRA